MPKHVNNPNVEIYLEVQNEEKAVRKRWFYLSLFVCVCLLAVGGVWFTNNNVDKLASNKGIMENANKDSEEEIHLIEKDKKDAIPTATDSKQNLEKAKSKEENKSSTTKLNYIGDKVIRGYSEKSLVILKHLMFGKLIKV